MAGEEESVLFAFEGDGTSALDIMDEIESAMQSLEEQITALAEAAGELSALDDAFAAIDEAASQAESALAGLSQGMDSVVASGGEATAVLEEVAAAATGLGDAGSGGAGALEESLAGIEETAASVGESLGSLDASLAGTSQSFADQAGAISADGEAYMSFLDVLDMMDSMLDQQALAVNADGEAIVSLGTVMADLAAQAAETEAAIAADAEAQLNAASSAAYLAAALQATGDAMAAANAQADAMAAGTQSAATSADALAASEANATAATDTASEAMNGAQMQLAMVGAVLVMAAGQFLQMGSKAEDAFAQIQGLAGATSQQMAGYSTTLQQYAVQFGTSLDQAANGLYYVISAGFSGADATNVLGQAMEAASAGGVSMQTTASALTSILNSYAAGADQAQKYTDYMTEAVVQGKQSYSDLAGSIGAAAVTGHAVGISFDQVAAAEATMTRSGLDAHRAVMNLDFMMRAVALGGGATAAAAAKKLGLSFDQTTYASMPLIDKLNYLKEITKGNQVEFEKLVGGANGFMAAQILMTDETKNYDQVLGSMKNSLGATDAAFQVSQQTISAAMGHVQGALSDVSYQLTELIQPAVGPALNALAAGFQFVADHIQQLMPILAGLAAFLAAVFIPVLWGLAAPILAAFAPFVGVALVIAGVTAALVALYNYFPPFRDAVNSVGQAFASFGSMVANSFDLVQRRAEESTLKTKLATVNTTIQQKQEILDQYRDQAHQIETQMNHTQDSVERHALAMKLKAINEANQQAQGVIDAAKKQRDGVEKELEKIDPVIAMHTLKQKDTTVSTSLIQAQEVVSNLSRQRAGIEQELQGCTDVTQRHSLEMQLAATNAAIKQKNGVVNALEQQKSGVEKQMQQTQQAINKDSQSNGLANMWKGIQNAAGAVASFFQSHIMPVFAAVGAFIATQFTPLWQQLQQVWTGQVLPAIKQIGQAIQPLLPFLAGVAALVGVVLVGAFGLLVGAVTGIATAIANMISGAITTFGGIVRFISGLIQVIVGIVRFIVDLFTFNFGALKGDLATIWAGIVDMFFGALTAIQGMFMTVWGAISGLIGGFIQGVITFFTHLWDELTGHSIIPDMCAEILQNFSDLVDKALNFVGNLVSNMLSKLGTLIAQAPQIMQQVGSAIMNTLASIASDALNAGANIVKSIASGITGSIGSAIGGAMSSVGSFISAHLPHSPAKIGPLRDLVLQGSLIPDQIAQGIDANMSRLETTMKKLSMNVSTTLQAQINSAGTSGGLAANQALPTLPQLPSLPSLPSFSSVPGTGAPGSNQQTINLLAQILAALVQQQGGNVGNITNVNMNNSISAPTANNPQQLLNVLLGLGGFSYESYQRGASGL